MRVAGTFLALALVTVVGCSDGLAGDSPPAAALPATVHCDDAAQLRARASGDRQAILERSSDQEKIDLASRARFMATLATIADLRCKVPSADVDEIVQRALDMARAAEDTRSFYARTLKWQEADLIADEAVGLTIQRLPGPTAK